VRLRELKPADLSAALKTHLSWAQQQRLDRMAPTHYRVPSGARRPIDYSGEKPVLAVRIQEMFGLCQTPTVARGRQTLLLHLLSPAGRPAQITEDLAGFWANSYPAVKKELKGRYPKHHWPDDPRQGQPRKGLRPR
jgi:ATP-dependent helicase HrpB